MAATGKTLKHDNTFIFRIGQLLNNKIAHEKVVTVLVYRVVDTL